jgi:hypothetical protein
MSPCRTAVAICLVATALTFGRLLGQDKIADLL